MPRIICISDTHNELAGIEVPDGDVLIHAGDFTRRGTVAEVEAFAADLERLPHEHKVVVAGNHDFLFQEQPAASRRILTGCIYLQDSGADVLGLRIWGSPWQPEFFDWAFNLPRGAPLREKWDLIPEKTDVLVTHGPPKGILDRTSDGEEVGCEELEAAVRRVRPRLHVFGHIHEAQGRHETPETTFVNASCCDVDYEPVQEPLIIDLE